MKRLNLVELIQDNLAFMRLAIILLLLSVATASVLYFGSVAFLSYAKNRSVAADQRHTSARDHSARTETEQEDIRLYLAPYRSLAVDSKAGEEKRLEWIDALGNIREQHKLFPIDYDIAARRPYTLPIGPSTSALNLSASRMNLQFGMLHEGDLLTLLNGLRTESKGYFVLNRCTLDRTVMAAVPQYGENLTGECTLDWLSFTPADSAENRP